MAPTANLDQKDRQFVAKVSPWSGLFPHLEKPRRCVLLPLRARFLQVDLDNCLPGNREFRPHFFNRKRNQSAFVKGVWTSAPQSNQGPKRPACAGAGNDPPRSRERRSRYYFWRLLARAGGKEVSLMQNKSSCQKVLAQTRLDGHPSHPVWASWSFTSSVR